MNKAQSVPEDDDELILDPKKIKDALEKIAKLSDTLAETGNAIARARQTERERFGKAVQRFWGLSEAKFGSYFYNTLMEAATDEEKKFIRMMRNFGAPAKFQRKDPAEIQEKAGTGKL